MATFWLALIVSIPERVAWLITAACFSLLALGFWRYGRARVVVDRGQLRAGRAHIDLAFVGQARALDAAQSRQVSGPLADARAFLLLRPYLPEAVQIAIDDPDDPTPYWLVATRRANRLATCINAARPIEEAVEMREEQPG